MPFVLGMILWGSISQTHPTFKALYSVTEYDITEMFLALFPLCAWIWAYYIFLSWLFKNSQGIVFSMSLDNLLLPQPTMTKAIFLPVSFTLKLCVQEHALQAIWMDNKHGDQMLYVLGKVFSLGVDTALNSSKDFKEASKAEGLTWFQFSIYTSVITSLVQCAWGGISSLA